MGTKVRIGIDVGGTFTDAVIIDNNTYEIVAQKKIPTTHEAGVATGIVQIISSMMLENEIAPEDVVFIAHGTTQATNALLEGDVANVGIIGMATGLDARSARAETTIGNLELAPGKYLNSEQIFIDNKGLNPTSVNKAIDDLVHQGAQVMVASEAYSVDNPQNEKMVMECAIKKGLYTTGGHEISQLYGLKMRTRTAVVNASLIPKMMETADMTELAVKETKIKSELMIMRCDGGVMNVDEVRKRPILTMLSGLAAGVAGALIYEKISDGIFFEAGGTSVDISVIKNGKVCIKYAQVGEHKTYLQSLDVRTLGIAGGSMIRVQNGKIIGVGPRSAHIAQKEYECFTKRENLIGAKVQFISPIKGDPCEYVTVVGNHGLEYSLTLAGAANVLGYVPVGDYAYGDTESAQLAWDALGKVLKISGKQAAKEAIDIAMSNLEVLVDKLICEYELDKNFITFVGGGGSAAVIVNPLGERMHISAEIAKNAPYISSIGVALAMVREQLERTVANPTEKDIKRIRADVIEQIIRSGANEDTVDVSIEVDSQKNILRAIATGATELRKKDLNVKNLTLGQLKEVSAQSLSVKPEEVEFICNTGRWYLFKAETKKKALFGLLKLKNNSIAVIDREGVVRLRKGKAECIKFQKQMLSIQFKSFLDENTTYSDANATIPKVFIFYREKMLDLTGMQTSKQLFSILSIEIEMLSPTEEIIAVAYK